MNDQQVDRITGLVGMALSIAFVYQAQGIEDSLLADAVGAGGVPTAVGVMLGLACLGLFLKTLRNPAEKVLAEDAAQENGEDALRLHLMAGGLLAILAVYVFLLPLLGYVTSIAFLIGSIAWFAGARKYRTILICMVTAGPLLWLMFDWALEIRLPVGLWSHWLGS